MPGFAADGTTLRRPRVLLLVFVSCAVVALSAACSGGEPVTPVAQVTEAFHQSGVDLVTHRELGSTKVLVPRDENERRDPSLQVLVFDSVKGAKRQEGMEIGLQKSGTATGEFFIARKENVFVVLPVGSTFDRAVVREALARL
jgi:hypothetical protein